MTTTVTLLSLYKGGVNLANRIAMRTLSGVDANGNPVTFEIESDGFMRVNNGIIQYSPDEKTWKDVIPVSDLIGGHSKNTSVHVTNTEKETWNNKSNFSGNYDDLNNKPTIPTVPTSLKNPNALIFYLGNVTYTYDGSEKVSITIEDGNEVIY